MTHYFEQEKDNAEPFKTKYPFHDDARKEYIKSLHARKTELFLEIVTAGKLPLRPGVKRLIQVGWYFFQTALPTTTPLLLVRRTSFLEDFVFTRRRARLGFDERTFDRDRGVRL